MSRKIGFLQRWMFIIDRINLRPYITKEELKNAVEKEFPVYDGVREVGTTSRTIERDLYEIRNSSYIDISIEYCRQRKGYYIPQDEKSLSKLDRMFEMSSLLSFSSLKDIVYVEQRESRGLEHRFTLIGAIRKNLEIVVEYQSYDGSAPRARTLRPYALREFRNRWYLHAIKADGREECLDNLKTYGLDRIRKLTVTNRTFRKGNLLDLRKKFEHCFGIYSNLELKPERVELSFSPLSGKYTQACPLHESQRTLVHDEHEFRVELMVKLTPDFLMELLAQGEGVRVIEPECLKQKLVDMHKRAVEVLLDTE